MSDSIPKGQVAQAMRDMVKENQRLMADLVAFQTFLAAMIQRVEQPLRITKQEIDALQKLHITEINVTRDKTDFLLRLTIDEAPPEPSRIILP